MGRKVFAILWLLLSACAPESGGVDVAVLQWDPSHGIYELRPATIETLDDVQALRGEAATAVGNASIVLGGNEVVRARTEAQLRDAVQDDPGSPVQAQYVEADGILYPSDFHSLNLATAYFNFERARLYALERGLAPGRLRGIPFHYFPEMRLGGSKTTPATDNAAYFPLLQAFLLFPHDRLQDIPLAMNLGVVAHEYGHALFHELVHQGAGLPTHPAAWCPDGVCPDPRGAIMLNLLEEGYADAWGVGVTRDPLFTHHSFSRLGDARVPAGFQATRHCYSQALYEQDLRTSAAMPPKEQEAHWTTRQYQVGTMIAGTLYQAGCWQVGAEGQSCRDRCLGDGDWSRYDQVLDALLASYSGDDGLEALLASDETGEAAGQFANVARTVIAAAGDAHVRRSLCSAWMDRMALSPEELGGLCDDATPTTLCSEPPPTGFASCTGLRRGGAGR